MYWWNWFRCRESKIWFQNSGDFLHKQKGHVKGKDGNWYDPNKRAEVEEYLDKNRGAKSYLDDTVLQDSRQAPTTTANRTTNIAAENPIQNGSMSNSFSKDMPNSTTEHIKSKGVDVPSGYKMSDSGIIVPESIKEPHPHVSNSSGWFSKLLGKSAKQAVRSLPFVGGIAGMFFAAEEAMAGNYERAGLEVVSAVSDFIPGAGTA